MNSLALRAGSVIFALLLGVGCASRKSSANEANEKIIPEDTQKESEALQGQQQMRMDELNMTSSEQAGQRHENATQPVEREEKAPKKK